MQRIINIINSISITLIPIAGFIVSLLTFLNERKKDKIDGKAEKEIKQKNIHGNNYYYEDNRTYEISSVLNDLHTKQQKISDRQQNIQDVGNFFIKYSSLYPLFVYVINLFHLMLPLPQLPIISLNPNEVSVLTFISTTLCKALPPTIINLLFTISLICLILVFKKLVVAKNVWDFISSLSFFVISAVYFCCKNITETFFDSIKTLQPEIHPLFIGSPLLIIPIVFIAYNNLIKILFETKQTKPNFKLLRSSIPRIIFYILLFIFPLFVIFFCQYI